jgi:hypothetical protein
MDWKKTSLELPPENTPVMTKIHDEKGCRNEAILIRKGGLWFVEDESIYVYYTPTHWAEIW